MARSRYKSEAKYKASLKHSAACNKGRRELIKKYGKDYMKDKDASHTSKGKVRAESRGKNQGEGRPKKGKEKYAKGRGEVSTKLNKKRGRPPKKSSTTSRRGKSSGSKNKK
jgi:hypothetical protein